MQALYFILAASHMVAIVVTGTLWTVIDLVPKTRIGLIFETSARFTLVHFI